MWTAQNQDSDCQALSWTAQVDYTVRTHAGNCWLKDRRGARTSSGDPNFNFTLFASAYVTADV